MNKNPNVVDPLSQAGVRCYEVFRNGYVAFEREGQLCFGPTSRLSAFLSGSNESFLTGEEAKAKVAQCHNRQRPTRGKTQTVDPDDGFGRTRRCWEAERSKGEWAPEFIRDLIAKIRKS